MISAEAHARTCFTSTSSGAERLVRFSGPDEHTQPSREIASDTDLDAKDEPHLVLKRPLLNLVVN